MSATGRIVMVDDEVELVRSAVGMLQREFGVDAVRGTSDSREALQWITAERPGLLITDVRMPHVSGLELVSRLHERWGQVPVVVITAFPTAPVPPEGARQMVTYLPKPFTFQKLTEAIRRFDLRAADASFSGDVAVTMLAEVVQLYGLANRTGVLKVQAGASQGEIWFQGGQVVHAVAEGREGMDAFFAILSWSSGRFSWAPTRPPASTISVALTELLLEAYRLNDEARAGAAGSSTPEPGDTLDEPTGRERDIMANVKDTLQKLEAVDGFIGAAVADSESGMALGTIGGNGVLSMDVAAASNTEVVRSKRKAMKALGLKDDIEDMLISLGKQYHLLRPVKSKPTAFIYLALDRTKANLAMARHALGDVEKDLSL